MVDDKFYSLSCWSHYIPIISLCLFFKNSNPNVNKCFENCGGTGAPGGNPQRPGEDMLTPHRRHTYSSELLTQCGEHFWLAPPTMSASYMCAAVGGNGDVLPPSCPTTGDMWYLLAVHSREVFSLMVDQLKLMFWWAKVTACILFLRLHQPLEKVRYSLPERFFCFDWEILPRV